MRLLILAAAATLAISGTAMAEGTSGKVARHHHHHFSDANAAIPEGAAPADVLSAHDAHLENLRESGYNPASDRDAAGNVRAN